MALELPNHADQAVNFANSIVNNLHDDPMNARKLTYAHVVTTRF